MTNNPNEVTVDNSVLIFIDHQPWVAFAVNSIDPSLLSNNLEGLASSAEALDVPVILTTVGAEGGKLRDPLMRAVADVFPDKTPIDRTSTNAWADIREEVEATGRKDIADGRAMDRGVSSPDRDLSACRRLPCVLRQRLLRRTDRRVARRRQAAPCTGRRDADQLGRCRVRVGARLHVRRTPQGQPGGHEERCRRWARPGTGFLPELGRRGGLRRTRTQEETDGETDRPREQVLRCVGQRPWRRRSSRVLHRRRRIPQ